MHVPHVGSAGSRGGLVRGRRRAGQACALAWPGRRGERAALQRAGEERGMERRRGRKKEEEGKWKKEKEKEKEEREMAEISATTAAVSGTRAAMSGRTTHAERGETEGMG